MYARHASKKKQQKFDWNQFVWYTQKITPQKNSNPYSLFIGHKNTRSDNNDQANYFALSQKKGDRKVRKENSRWRVGDEISHELLKYRNFQTILDYKREREKRKLGKSTCSIQVNVFQAYVLHNDAKTKF